MTAIPHSLSSQFVTDHKYLVTPGDACSVRQLKQFPRKSPEPKFVTGIERVAAADNDDSITLLSDNASRFA